MKSQCLHLLHLYVIPMLVCICDIYEAVFFVHLFFCLIISALRYYKNCLMFKGNQMKICDSRCQRNIDDKLKAR